MTWGIVLILAFVQNVSFCMASRSRNRDNMAYHAICSVFSNVLWFLTMQQLVLADLTAALLLPYVVGTVGGSLAGGWASIRIERLIGAKT